MLDMCVGMLASVPMPLASISATSSASLSRLGGVVKPCTMRTSFTSTDVPSAEPRPACHPAAPGRPLAVGRPASARLVGWSRGKGLQESRRSAANLHGITAAK